MTVQMLKLGDYITLTKGKPPTEMPYFGQDAEPYLSPDFLRGKGAAESAKSAANGVLVSDGETILLWDGSNAGEVFRARDGLLSSTMTLIKHSDEFDPKYFCYAVKRWEPYLKGQTSGSGIPHVDKEVLGKLEILKLPPDEQTLVANILTNLDRIIEQTEALIRKQQRIKAGLMQDLLTRGIDEHGNIRSETTHAFKDSPLGRIPVEWDVQELKSLLADVDPAMRSGPFGSALLKEELAEAGIPLLGIDNVLPEKFVSDYKRFVPPKKAEQLRRYLVRPRDLIITIMGTVGRCCVVPDDIGKALSSKHVWTISIDQAKYSPYVACLQINHSPWVLEHFAKDEQGGIMASIRAETLRTTKLPVPPPPELEKIESILRSISADLVEKEVISEKLCSLKVGLMHDLLTGERRVIPLLAQVVTQ
ncbi:restriction endonuclease subunit S [Pseudomonas sp. RTB3]|uniref:restriction endonuclease subunit S n=1 Tax=unclassified Pseudomonas TaxID=196821 RepID=UPI002B237D5C|nr:MULTISPECIES: restriction endonuclease subunit S [unclassified Pseudomonas]MEB0007256.1 restriction endonuclease subunit S [Pseudomonas sp. RTB2]MEB0019439.1 restriction endonuclease subunit S [Pseudomonas sp. RTB3]MEB0270404.1 restriction endonuclease subunit S [Pseudomonas sp. 5B4]